MRLLGTGRVTIEVGAVRIQVRHKDDLDKAVEAAKKLLDETKNQPLSEPPKKNP